MCAVLLYLVIYQQESSVGAGSDIFRFRKDESNPLNPLTSNTLEQLFKNMLPKRKYVPCGAMKIIVPLA